MQCNYYGNMSGFVCWLICFNCIYSLFLLFIFLDIIGFCFFILFGSNYEREAGLIFNKIFFSKAAIMKCRYYHKNYGFPSYFIYDKMLFYAFFVCLFFSSGE